MQKGDLTANLELGQIIQLIAPKNDDINNKIFLIDYLDKNFIKLVDQELNYIEYKIVDKDGKKYLTEESILNILILHQPEEEGFARQNGYVVDKWISIEIQGEHHPEYIDGKITNLEEDCIEFTTHPNKDVIYFDFQYKGMYIPEYKILSINDFNPVLDRTEIPKELLKVNWDDLDDLSDIDDEILPEEDTEELNQNIQAMIFDAKKFIFQKTYKEVNEEKEASIDEYRYDMETQLNDMLNSNLEKLDNFQKTSKNLNKINVRIERFKSLRKAFSNFDNIGNVTSFKIKYKKNSDGKVVPYKPLVNNLLLMKNVPLWIIPIVKNKKMILDVPIEGRTSNIDTIWETSNEFIKNRMQLDASCKLLKKLGDKYHIWDQKLITGDENKFHYYYKNLNIRPYENIYSLTEKNDVIMELNIKNSLNTIVDNFDNFYSSSAKGIPVKDGVWGSSIATKNSLSILRHISSLEQPIFYKNKGVKMTKKLDNIERNDNISLKGFLLMPENLLKYSRLYNFNSLLSNKINLHSSPFQYWHYLNKKTEFEIHQLNPHLNENRISENILNFKNIKHISYDNNNNDYGSIDNQETYKKFLNQLIPETKILFNKIKNYIDNRWSYLKVVDFLQMFSINNDDITKDSIRDIKDYIENNIIDFKKSLYGDLFRNNIYIKGIKTYKVSSNMFDFFTDKKLDEVIQKIDQLAYNMREKKENTVEYLKKTLSMDAQRLLMNSLAMVNLKLAEPINVEMKLSELKHDIEQAEKAYEKGDNCEKLILAKRYALLDDLQDDDKNPEIYFNKQYDQTDYSMYDDKMKNDFKSFSDKKKFKSLKQYLISKKYTAQNIDRDAKAMLDGKKLVEENDYAVLDLGDYDYKYYKRKNHIWQEDKNLIGQEIEEISFCNIQSKCLLVKQECATENRNREIIKKNIMKEILNNFEDEIEKTAENLMKELEMENQYYRKNIELLTNYKKKEFIKYDKDKIILASQAITFESVHSKWEGLRDDILNQSDIINKYEQLLIFCENYCREYNTLNPLETKYWLYCKEVNIPLLPSYYLDLAKSWKSGNYVSMLNKVINERGEDMGDRIVDKYSGYFIKFIGYDESEGYTKEGFKILSRGVMEEESEDEEFEEKDDTKIQFVKSSYMLNKKASNEEKISLGIIQTLDQKLGIDTSVNHTFMMNYIITQLKTIKKSEKEYKKKRKKIIKKAAKDDKVPPKWDKHYDDLHIQMILGIYAIGLQTLQEFIFTYKSYPGCIKSFEGFPLGKEGDISFLKYLICIALKIRNETRPLKLLPKIKAKKTEKERLEKYIKKIKSFINKYLMKKKDIKLKLKEKNLWLEKNKSRNMNISSIPSNVKKWDTFNPPLNKFTLKSTKMIQVNNFEKNLAQAIGKNQEKVAKNEHNKHIIELKSKIISISLGIQEKIQSVIDNEPLIMKSLAGEYFTENSCCYLTDKNAYNYFVGKNETIGIYNENVKKLESVYDKYKNLLISPNFVTKNEMVEREKGDMFFTDKTIYLTFINYCNLDNKIQVEDDLQHVCGERKTILDKIESNEEDANKMIEEKNKILREQISQLKREGKIYTKDSLLQLLNIIYNKNIIDYDYVRTPVVPRVNFENYLENNGHEILEENVLTGFKNLLDRFEMTTDDDDNVFELLIRNMEETNDEIEEELLEIMKDKGKNVNVEKFLNEILEFNKKGNSMYMVPEDENGYYTYRFLLRKSINICQTYPTFIINKSDYSLDSIKTYKYWNAGKLNNTLIRKNISNELLILQQFHGKDILINLLKNIKEKSKKYIKLLDNLPFFSSIQVNNNILKGAYNGRMLSKIAKYIFYQLLKLYIDTIDDIVDVEGDDEVLLITERETVKESVTDLLDAYFEILLKHKKYNNYSNKMIENLANIGKNREKEIFKIESKSKSKDEKRVNKLLKKHKLGDWNDGASTAIYRYNANYFEKELNKMKTILTDDKYKEHVGDEYSNLQKEIFGNLVNDAEYIQIEQSENYDLSGYAEDGDAGEEGLDLDYGEN